MFNLHDVAVANKICFQAELLNCTFILAKDQLTPCGTTDPRGWFNLPHMRGMLNHLTDVFSTFNATFSEVI